MTKQRPSDATNALGHVSKEKAFAPLIVASELKNGQQK